MPLTPQSAKIPGELGEPKVREDAEVRPFLLIADTRFPPCSLRRPEVIYPLTLLKYLVKKNNIKMNYILTIIDNNKNKSIYIIQPKKKLK